MLISHFEAFPFQFFIVSPDDPVTFGELALDEMRMIDGRITLPQHSELRIERGIRTSFRSMPCKRSLTRLTARLS